MQAGRCPHWYRGNRTAPEPNPGSPVTTFALLLVPFDSGGIVEVLGKILIKNLFAVMFNPC